MRTPTKNAVSAPLGDKDFFRRPCALSNEAKSSGITGSIAEALGQPFGMHVKLIRLLQQ